MIDKAFCAEMAAVAVLKAASYSATSTSKMKKGYIAEAAAWTALGARLTPPPPVPPPSNGLMWALDPDRYMNVGAPMGASVHAGSFTPVGGAVEDVHFTVNTWFGVLGSTTPTILRNCTIEGAFLGATGGDLADITLIDCEVRNCDNLLRLNGNVTLERCWLHSPSAAPGSHVDGLEFWAGSNVRIIDCRVELPTHNPNGSDVERGATAAANLRSNIGPIDDVLFQRCVLLGGGMPLLVRSEGDPYQNTNIRLDDVVLDGGHYGAVNGDSTTSASITQWDNVRKLDGTPIPRP